MEGEGKGIDPNEQLIDERARGEDPRLADISESQNKDNTAGDVPFKITTGK